MCDEEGEGHPNPPELTIVIGVAAQGGEVLDAAPRVVVAGQIQEGARAAGRSPLGGVALAGAVGVGDEVVGGDLGNIALAEGQGLALLLVGAFAGAAIGGGSEEGRVRGGVGMARRLPGRWGDAVPVGDREGGYVGGCGGDVFVVVDLCEVCAAAGPDGPVEEESGVGCALCDVVGWMRGGDGACESVVGALVTQVEPDGSTEGVACGAYDLAGVYVCEVVPTLATEVARVRVIGGSPAWEGAYGFVTSTVGG